VLAIFSIIASASGVSTSRVVAIELRLIQLL
jgi:hypothetical protein